MNIFLYIPVSILWITCVIANLIVIFTFFTNRSLRNNYSYWYPTALAILDLIFGSTAIPLHILTTEGILPVDSSTCNIVMAYQAALVFPEIFLLLVMAIDRFNNVSNPQMNNNRRASVIRCFLIITTSSVMGVLFVFIFKLEYDATESNCYFLKRNTDLPAWIKYFAVYFNIGVYFVMAYFNMRVFRILYQFNSMLENRFKHNVAQNGLNNNGELMELSYAEGKVSVVKIITSNPTIHDVRKGKTIRGWIQESKKQRRLLTMIIALEFTCFFTNLPTCLMFFAVNYTSCEICRDNVILRNICPWAFFVNQALDPLILLLTNGSFRRRVKLFFPRLSLSSTSNRLMWRNIWYLTTSS